MQSLVSAPRDAASAAISVQEITRPAALRELADEWRRLVERCPDATPFQRPEWLVPWCERLGPAAIWALELRANGRLVGLAPLFVEERAGERVVRLLGAGVSDYLDAVIDPALARAGAFAIASHLAANADLWDACELEALRPSSPLLRMPLPPAWIDDTEQDDACPVLRLPSSPDRFADAVPAETRRSVRRALARAELAGALSLTSASAATRAELLDALFALHKKRWSRLGAPGVLDGDALAGFHRDVSAGFHAVGRLLLHAACLDGKIIGVVYGFLGDLRAYLYLQGFDPEHERLSPGALAVHHAIEGAARAGAREVDFLRGRERYKHAWGALDQPTYRRSIRRA